MHLTNYSLNKKSPNYIYEEELHEIHSGTKRTLSSLWKSVEKAGYSSKKIIERIEELLVKFLKSIHPFLLYNYQTLYGKNAKKGKCFHVIGFDVLIDYKLKPWLIEINANPSFNIEHEKNFNIKLPSDNVISPIDCFVKEKVMGDTLKIVNHSIEDQENFGVGKFYNSFKQIYCEEVQYYEYMNVFKDLLEIYGKLSGFKFKGSITASKFVKLANLPKMTSQSFPKTSYDIIFKKILRNNYDSTHMDFEDFISSIEEIAKNLYLDYDEENKFNSVGKLIQQILENLQ